MSQFKIGRVRTRNGEATVRYVHRSALVNHNGTNFQLDEVVDWTNPGGGTGQGVVTSWDDVTLTVGLSRTSGDRPIIGATATGATSGASGDVDSFISKSPPRYDLELAVGQWFTTNVGKALFQVGGNLTEDSFDLSVAFTEDLDESTYGVFRDLTTHRGYLLVEVGDLDPITAINRFQVNVDTDVERALAPPVEQVASDRTLQAPGDRNLVLLVDDSGATRTVTLPDNVTAGAGYRATVKKLSAANQTDVAAVGSDTIDGAASASLTTQWEHLVLIADGAGSWLRID